MGAVSGVSIVLLCEDKQTEVFLRRFLMQRSFDGRDIRTSGFPDGKQSGEQWVRNRYPQELRAIRSRQQAYLIVAIDADKHSSRERRKQLDDACLSQNVQCRTQDDSVAILVPRRNIETWLAYVKGEAVDETAIYYKLKKPRECSEHARLLHRMCYKEQKLRVPAPESLKEACYEFDGLKLGR